MLNKLKPTRELFFILVIAVVLRLLAMNKPFTASEVSLLLPNWPLKDFFLDVTLEQTLPLYPLFLSFWTALVGEGEWLIRLPQLILALLSIGLVYRITQKMASKLASTISLLIAISPLHITLSTSLSPVMPLFVLLLPILWWVVSTPKNRWFVTIFTALAFLTHPASWVIIPLLVAFKRSCVLPATIGGLVLLLWAPFLPISLVIFLQQIDVKPSLTPLFTSMKVLMTGSFSVTGVFFYLLMAVEAYFFAWVIGKSRLKNLFLSMIAGLPLLLALLFAMLTGVPAKGMLLFVLVPLLTLFAIGLEHFKVPLQKTIILYLFILINLTFAQAAITSEVNRDWPAALKAMKAVAPNTETVIFPSDRIPPEWRWYSKDAIQTFAVTPQDEKIAKLIAADKDSFTIIIPGGVKSSRGLVEWFSTHGFNDVQWFEVRSFGYLVVINRNRPLAVQ